MHPALKRALVKVFPTYTTDARVVRLLVRNRNSYLHATGWIRSLQEQRPVGSDGAAVPWMNYSVVALLRARLTKDLRLLEFGSGYSTSFYAKLVGSVTSVEHDQAWIGTVKKTLPDNVELIYQPQDIDGKYCRVIHSSGVGYDVVVIDGWDRVNCIRQSIEALTARGVIVLDDSHRAEYKDGTEYAISRGFAALPLEGLKPTGYGVDQTTLFYRRDNCLGL
jgi:hypothetical protein